MQTIEPCRDAQQVRTYIDTYWRKDHVLARDEKMFAFQYQTPWVDRRQFPSGISVVCAYDGEALVGFLGAIVAPYPCQRSMWLALWHVLPDTKGSGLGGKLLQAMQELAIGPDGGGWIGTFGAGPAALPVYLKRGFGCRAVRRWVYDPALAEDGKLPASPSLNLAEQTASAEWLRYRYEQHPTFKYEQAPGGVFRTYENPWGVVTHALLLRGDWRSDVARIYARASGEASSKGRPYLLDAWAFDCPGPGFRLAPEDLPSVFAPPEARGNLVYCSGKPFTPAEVQRGDCDQDRPN